MLMAAIRLQTIMAAISDNLMGGGLTFLPLPAIMVKKRKVKERGIYE